MMMVVILMVYLHCPTILAHQSEVRLKLAKKEKEVCVINILPALTMVLPALTMALAALINVRGALFKELALSHPDIN